MWKNDKVMIAPCPMHYRCFNFAALQSDIVVGQQSSGFVLTPEKKCHRHTKVAAMTALVDTDKKLIERIRILEVGT